MNCDECCGNVVQLKRRVEGLTERVLERNSIISDQDDTIKAMDQVIKEQSTALGEQRKARITGWTEIPHIGVRLLRVRDEYWVDFENFCELLDTIWILFACSPTVIRFKGLPVVYKEELD